VNVLLISLSLVFVANSQITNLYSTRQSGDGTYYGTTNGKSGACSVYPRPSFMNGLTTVAINNPQWLGSATCGMCVQVTGTGSGSGANPVTGTFIAVVDDLCPECLTGSLDIARNSDGRWGINWVAVDCPVKGGLTYFFQGSNPYYLKMQVGNHRVPVKAVQFQKNGKWYNGQRTSDNFWNPVGYPYPASFPLNVRVQGVNGQWVSDVVPIISTTPVTGQKIVQIPGIKAATAKAVAAGSQTLGDTTSTPAMSIPVIAVVVSLVAILVIVIVIIVIFVVRTQHEITNNTDRP